MRTTLMFTAGIIFAGILFVSCSSRNTGTGGYLAYDDPDHLLVNMERAFKNRDLPEYRDRVLYGGKKTGRHGLLLPAFTFYVAEGGNLDAAEPVYGFDKEVEVAAAMFGKQPSRQDGRTVSSLDLVMERLDEWKPVPAGKEILGDPCPDGTETCRIGGVLRLTMAPEEPGGEENRNSVHHSGRVYVIPVRNSATEGQIVETYCLWKWIDIGEDRR